MTWGHDVKNCPHKGFTGGFSVHCGLDDHKTKDCPRNEDNYNVNICMQSEKKMNTK